ncbi:SRPBCC domain-containing protein [Flagellimonas sp. DF-77]|uniref:SRPBCC domain-containing protein n=1 Tax=Flagellimonas algarum TaxID=3230298 RepID=UPI003395FF4C
MEKKFNLGYLSILLCSLTLLSCYSVKKTVESSKPNSEQINWPENYKPEDAGFFVHNEIDINAEPQIVWDILVKAEDWSTWYLGAKDVKIQNSNLAQLEENTIFSWKTMGQNFESTTIKEFEPPYRLSWEATKNNIRGYHAWLIIPTNNGCKVITSETQHGFLTFMQKIFLPNKLEKLHDIWLTELKNKAENEIKE